MRVRIDKRIAGDLFLGTQRFKRNDESPCWDRNVTCVLLRPHSGDTSALNSAENDSELRIHFGQPRSPLLTERGSHMSPDTAAECLFFKS